MCQEYFKIERCEGLGSRDKLRATRLNEDIIRNRRQRRVCQTVGLKSIVSHGSSGKRSTGLHKKWTDRSAKKEQDKTLFNPLVREKNARKRSINDGRKEKGAGRNT
jgi:hypothetical protein